MSIPRRLVKIPTRPTIAKVIKQIQPIVFENFLNLPRDLTVKCLFYISTLSGSHQELVHLAKSCKTMNLACQNEELWRQIYLNMFFSRTVYYEQVSSNMKIESWRSEFIRRVSLKSTDKIWVLTAFRLSDKIPLASFKGSFESVIDKLVYILNNKINTSHLHYYVHTIYCTCNDERILSGMTRYQIDKQDDRKRIELPIDSLTFLKMFNHQLGFNKPIISLHHVDLCS